MSDRIYLFFVGLTILTALYLESNLMIYMVAIIMFLEGLSGWTLPRITQTIRKVELEPCLLKLSKPPRFNFESFLVMRLVLASVVLASYVAVHEYDVELLWFFPWFVGFAVLGAGVSGVCPVYLAIRWLGFK